MSTKNIPVRSEVLPENTWDLTDIFPSDDAWLLEYEALKLQPAEIKAFQGKLGADGKTLCRYFELDEALSLRLSKFYGYASCRSDEDTGNAKYQDFRSKAIAVLVAIRTASAFAVPEILSIPQDKLDGFFIETPELEAYRRPISTILRRKPHVLSDACEALLAGAGEMAEAPDQIRSTLADADLRFPDVTDAEGNVHKLTGGSFVPLLESEDPAFRETVFKTYYKTLDQFKNTIAATLDAQFKQLRYFATVRRYPATLEASLDATEVPVSVYHNLIEAVHGNLDKMYRYVSLRKKLLGLQELHMYDVYTPIIQDFAKEIEYEDAKQTVLDALSIMGDDYLELLKTGFSNRWIDVYENVGKRGGAYSSGNAYPHPYVLLNYKGNLDSVFTLAHEMGHALHSHYSCTNQRPCNADYVIFVAEVASTCNEVLLMRYLLSRTQDKKEKAYLINHFLDQFKGTIYRQTMFAEFELFMGKMCEQGEKLTAELLNKKYLELNRLYFGPDMVSDPEIALEWARIPHFFYNYYVFQYATGFSAAVAIANKILHEGAPAVAAYKKFLSGGGSADPISLLKIAGIDMSTSEPVNSALSLFGELIDELEALV